MVPFVPNVTAIPAVGSRWLVQEHNLRKTQVFRNMVCSGVWRRSWPEALIRKVLEETDWNLNRSAMLLHIARGTLYIKMGKYNIRRPDMPALLWKNRQVSADYSNIPDSLLVIRYLLIIPVCQHPNTILHFAPTIIPASCGIYTSLRQSSILPRSIHINDERSAFNWGINP